MIRFAFLVALFSVVLTGCGTTNTKSASADDDEKVYTTGSRIPVKDRSAANTSTDRNAIDSMMRKGVTGGGGN
jgi:ABC-type oligopeptide transport system substrate-binding subunit